MLQPLRPKLTHIVQSPPNRQRGGRASSPAAPLYIQPLPPTRYSPGFGGFTGDHGVSPFRFTFRRNTLSPAVT